MVSECYWRDAWPKSEEALARKCVFCGRPVLFSWGPSDDLYACHPCSTSSLLLEYEEDEPADE